MGLLPNFAQVLSKLASCDWTRVDRKAKSKGSGDASEFLYSGIPPLCGCRRDNYLQWAACLIGEVLKIMGLE